MKKTFLYLIWALAIILQAAGCEKAPQGGENGGEGVTPSEYLWHFSVNNADAAQPLGLFVKEYDGVINNADVHLDATSGASFTLKTDFGFRTGGKIYAYSPWSSASSDHKAVRLSIPEEQTAGALVMPKVSAPLVLSEPEPATTITVTMLDLAATLAVKVVSTEATGEKLQSISFTSAGNPLAGEFSFNLKGADANQPSTLAISGYDAATVTLSTNASIGTEDASAVAQSMLLAPGSYTGTVTVKTDKDTYGIKVDDPVVLTRGAVTELLVSIAPRQAQDGEGGTEEFEGGELETGDTEAAPEGSISILAIGNSFSIDGMQYL